MPTTAVLVGFGIMLLVAYALDVRSWRVKPREELVGMVRAQDYRFHMAALSELRRRGEDVTVFLSSVLPLLVSESRTERVAGEMVLRKFFPEEAREIKGYSPMADVEVCREKVAPLFERYAAGA